MRKFILSLTLVFLALASPAAAQFSDSYNFIKAVKDKDGAKANELVKKPGTTVVNARDADTGDYGLHIATRRTDLAWVGFLLKAGATLNVRDREGNTPLLLASIARWTEGLQVFITVKAQLDLQNRLGETALLKATQNRDYETAKLLVDAGASPDITDNSGSTAREFAQRDPRGEAIAKLFADVAVKKPRPAQGPSL